MTVGARIAWDEENNPGAFFWCWATTQLILILTYILIAAHLLPPTALNRSHGGPRVLLLLAYLLFLTTASLYLQLVMNGFWHRNPELQSPNDEELGASDLHEVNHEEEESTPPGLFEQSILKNPDPIVTRDQVQWTRILLATTAMGTLIFTFVLL
ncbi:MAG: hypothetical protein WB561_18795 [Terracidiphilus sp.]